MLRKRTRSIQKEHQMGHPTTDTGSDMCLQSGVAGQKQKTSSFFNVPGLLIGLTPKGVTDCDSVRSPTSPLDFKLLSNLGSAFRSPRCSHEGHQKSWVCCKVGLGIVDTLDVDDGKLGEKVVGSVNSKSILFGPQIRTKTPNSPTKLGSVAEPKSLPKSCAIFPHAQFKSPSLDKGSSDVLFEIGEDPLEPFVFTEIRSFSLDSKSLGLRGYGLVDHRSNSGSSRSSGLGKSSVREDSASNFIGGSPNLEDASQDKLSSAPVVAGFGNGYVGHLSPSEIELSEDYTCVISHGPNPKTTHIFGDFILECHAGETDARKIRGGVGLEIPELVKCSKFSASYPSDDFLSFCYFCNKKLEEGKDIYMFRGEKAFCSSDCRSEEILIEEGKDKSVAKAPKESTLTTDREDNFEDGMFVAI